MDDGGDGGAADGAVGGVRRICGVPGGTGGVATLDRDSTSRGVSALSLTLSSATFSSICSFGGASIVRQDTGRGPPQFPYVFPRASVFSTRTSQLPAKKENQRRATQTRGTRRPRPRAAGFSPMEELTGLENMVRCLSAASNP